MYLESIVVKDMSDSKEPSAEKRVTSPVSSGAASSDGGPKGPVSAARHGVNSGKLTGQSQGHSESVYPPSVSEDSGHQEQSDLQPPDPLSPQEQQTHSLPMHPTQSSPPFPLNHRDPTSNMQNPVPNIRIVSADNSSGGSPAHRGLTHPSEGGSPGVNDHPSPAGDSQVDSSYGNNRSAIPSETPGNFYSTSGAAADAQHHFNPAAANGNDNYGLVDGERSEAVGLGSSGGAGESNRQSSTSPTAVPTQLQNNPFNGVYDRGKKKKRRKGGRQLGLEGKNPDGIQSQPDGGTEPSPCETYATYQGYQNISDAHLQNSNTRTSLNANQVSSPTESCDSPSGHWDSTAGGGASVRGSLQSPDLLSPHSLVEDASVDDTVPPSPPVPGSPSKWAKLRTTLKMAGAVSTSVAKKRNRKTSTLMRQDSFLKRFSTRHGGGATTISEESDEEENKYEQIQIQREAQQKRVLRFIINPDENFMFFWLGVLTMSVMYNLWTCIAREAFPQIVDGYEFVWISTDATCDFLYLMDIFVQLRTGYLERGLMVSNNKMLAGHYLRSKFFILDVCSLIPLDLAQIFLGIHPILRFPRFLKLYRSYRFVYMVETRTIYPNTWRVVNLTHVLFLGSHWFAAFYFMISKAEGFEGTWGYPKPVDEFASVTRMYLKSLYWSTLTLTTIGDLPPPESNWEYVFTIVSYLIGVFVFATIVGQVGNVITNRNASRQEFERLLDGAKAYMRNHNVPIEMQRRVQRWYDYAWSRGRMTGGGDINSLGLLPDKLKTEIALHVNLETLKKVTIFQECEPEFLHDLVLKMRAFIFTPGDLICRKGEVAREMFIIADGLLEVISDSGEVLTQMSAGDFFGEIGILNLDGGVNRRTADVRSVGYSELFVLSREDVLSALKDHPEAEALIKAYGRKRLKEIEDHKKKKMQERLAKRKANSNPASTNCSPVHQMVNASTGLLQRVIQLGRKQSISADNLHIIGRALTTTDYKPTLKPDGSTLLERVITLGRNEQAARSQNQIDSSRTDRMVHDSPFQSPQHEIQIEMEQLPSSENPEVPPDQFKSGSVRRRRSNGMHETRLSKPANNQTLGVSSAHQSAFRQSSLPSQLLPKTEEGGRVNLAHEHSTDEDTEDEEDDALEDEEKAMIESQSPVRRKSSGAGGKVAPSQSWQQAVEPLWPIEAEMSTGPGHAGAGAVSLPNQDPGNQSVQSFGGLMVSLNSFLQHKLSEYQASCEERIYNLEEDNNSKQQKIRQLENQILTLQRALMDSSSSGDLPQPPGGQN